MPQPGRLRLRWMPPKAAIRHAQAQLEYSKIYSPIDGVITDRPLYAGEMASPDTPLLTVMDISRIVPAPMFRLSSSNILKWAMRRPSPLGFLRGTSRAKSGGQFRTGCEQHDRRSVGRGANPGERFKPGSSVQVSILAETVPDALVIPLAAILPAEEGADNRHGCRHRFAGSRARD